MDVWYLGHTHPDMGHTRAHTHTCVCTRAPNHIAKHSDIPLTHSGTDAQVRACAQSHTHTHTAFTPSWFESYPRPSETDCLFTLRGCFWELSDADGGGISHPLCRHKCQNIILSTPHRPALACTCTTPATHAHTRSLNRRPPGGILNKAEVIRMFLLL